MVLRSRVAAMSRNNNIGSMLEVAGFIFTRSGIGTNRERHKMSRSASLHERA